MKKDAISEAAYWQGVKDGYEKEELQKILKTIEELSNHKFDLLKINPNLVKDLGARLSLIRGFALTGLRKLNSHSQLDTNK